MIFSENIRRIALGLVSSFAFFLAACAPGSLLVDVGKAAWSGTTSASGIDVLGTPLNPNYLYLHVALAGQAPALLVLGYLDPHPLGDIEVWYASTGDVLRLQNGRVVGSSGLAVNWLRVSFPQNPPAWNAVPSDGARFSRQRDESPGFRYAIQEQVLLKPTTPPDTQALSRVHLWYSEIYTSSTGESLPGALFGLASCQGQQTVVYSRQCLGLGQCLTLQPWPPKKDCP